MNHIQTVLDCVLLELITGNSLEPMLAQRLSRYSLDIFYEARSVIRLSFVTFRYMYDTCWACVEHLLIAMKPWILVDKRQTIIGTHELKVFKLLFICLRKIEIE